MKFRNDVEGLRGVAILLVVLCHAGVPGLAAGFIGVDVFFVISGFLITGLLMEELRQSNRIDYWAFYARRARRLAPALLVMTGLVCVAAVWLVPASMLKLQLTSALWTVLWASNFFFTFAGFEYFGPGASDSLFLHTWSLAVEEQFYLVWPLLLASIGSGRLSGTRWLLFMTVAGFLASLTMLHFEPLSAYYLMPSRIWQLAFGGLIFRWSESTAWGDTGNRRAAGLSGVAALLSGLFAIKAGTPYPGWVAVLPTVGSGLLLLAGTGSGPRGFGTRLLASEVLQFLGRISYSWYLWHWPFLVILPAMGVGATPRLRLFLLLTSLLVALGSYRWIEAPFRRRRAAPRATVGAASLCSLLIALLIVLTIFFGKSAVFEERRAVEAMTWRSITLPDLYERPECDQWYSSSALVPCRMHAPESPAGTVMLIGDSVGAQWSPALEEAAKLKGFGFVVLTKSACPIVDEPMFYERLKRRYLECERWREAAIEYAFQIRPDVVVIGSGQYGFSDDEWRFGTRRIVDLLARNGVSVIVLLPTPVLPFDARRCIATRGVLVGGKLRVDDCSAPLEQVEPVRIQGLLTEAVEESGVASTLYLNDLVCPEKSCKALRGDQVVFRDNQHLNARVVKTLAPEFLQRLDRALEKTQKR